MAIKLQSSKGAVTIAQQMKKGDKGVTYYPSVSEDGWLSWIPSEEGAPEIEPSYIKGQQGIQGEQGKDGLSLIHIGEEEPDNPDCLVWLFTSPDAISSAEEVSY